MLFRNVFTLQAGAAVAGKGEVAGVGGAGAGPGAVALVVPSRNTKAQAEIVLLKSAMTQVYMIAGLMSIWNWVLN